MRAPHAVGVLSACTTYSECAQCVHHMQWVCSASAHQAVLHLSLTVLKEASLGLCLQHFWMALRVDVG